MIDIIRQRRSIRRFTADAIEPEKIELLKEAALRSPASKNANAWEFIFVDDRELVSALAVSKPYGSKLLETAPLAVVVMADDSKTEAWVEDCSVASSFLMLTAQSLGLGNCWVQIREREHDTDMSAETYVQQLLEIPSNYKILSIVAIGYAAQERKAKEASELQTEKIHLNKFGSKAE